MKTIKYIKGMVFLTMLSVLFGCKGITVIPTLVTKDIALAKVTVSGLQDESYYQTSSTVDLTKAVSADKLKGLTSAKIKGFTLKIGNDYENTATKSKILTIIFAVAVQRGLQDNNTGIGYFTPNTGDEADIPIEGNWSGAGDDVSIARFDSSIQNSAKFTFTHPLEIANYIVDGKLTLNIVLLQAIGVNGNFNNFNDNSFSFDLSVDTEVEVGL